MWRTPMDKIYLQYAEIFSEVSLLELELSEKRRALSEVRSELEKHPAGNFGLDLTAHAFTNITDRLSGLASEFPVIYNDVFNPGEPSRALLWPSNLRAFIISMLASANSKKQFSEKPSKNNAGGKEYHYDIEIKKWSTDRDILLFTAIVEDSVIKTGYFNWVGRK
jgi:hypothetical protein